LIYVDCEVASVGLFGVLETQGWAVPGRELGGVGVFSLRSSLETTFSGSKGTSPAPRTPSDVLFYHSTLVSCVKRREEVFLGDVGDVSPHQALNLLAVRDLQRAETTDIEWLEEV
jgi:hypothetical protein